MDFKYDIRLYVMVYFVFCLVLGNKYDLKVFLFYF